MSMSQMLMFSKNKHSINFNIRPKNHRQCSWIKFPQVFCARTTCELQRRPLQYIMCPIKNNGPTKTQCYSPITQSPTARSSAGVAPKDPDSPSPSSTIPTSSYVVPPPPPLVMIRFFAIDCSQHAARFQHRRPCQLFPPTEILLPYAPLTWVR